MTDQSQSAREMAKIRHRGVFIERQLQGGDGSHRFICHTGIDRFLPDLYETQAAAIAAVDAALAAQAAPGEHVGEPQNARNPDEFQRLEANFKDVVETKRRTGERLKWALAGLQRIYNESTETRIAEIAGEAFERATHEAPLLRLSDETAEAHWRHKKRGSIVTEVARGFAQVSVHPIEEMTAVVIYKHDGHWWVRNAVEFDDGRFEPVETSPHSRPDRGGDESVGGSKA